MFNWIPGRQSEQYEKLKIFSFWFLDCYLIRYQAGFQLPIHTDPVENKKHYRLNIVLRGENAYVGNYIFKFYRIVCFRSDLPHGTKIITKPRLILSFGWVI
jgi:hypothetical protein